MKLLFKIHTYQPIFTDVESSPVLNFQSTVISSYESLLEVKQQAKLLKTDSTIIIITDSLGNVYKL